MTAPEQGTQNKTGEKPGSKTAQKQAAEVNSVMTTAPGSSPLTEGDVTVVGREEGLQAVSYDESAGDTLVTIKGDVVEEFFFPNTRRPSYRTLYHAGQQVPKAVIDQYNADVERRQLLAANGGVDPENPAGIDSTTIASGTRVKPVEGSDQK